MTTFNWKVMSPNTLRAQYAALAAFEKAMLVPASEATAADLAAWQLDMEAGGLSVNTIRSYLSMVSRVAGVKVQLPKKKKAIAFTMSDDQVKAFFQKIEKDTDRELLAGIFLTGRPVPNAHWLASSHKFTTQEITRKIKRYARLAGLNQNQINMRSFTRNGQQMIKKYSADYVAQNLLVRPVQPMVEWRALHGIGRRSRRAVKV